jgi:hypothetical protein
MIALPIGNLSLSIEILYLYLMVPCIAPYASSLADLLAGQSSKTVINLYRQ